MTAILIILSLCLFITVIDRQLVHKIWHYESRCYISGKISGLEYTVYARNFSLASKTVGQMGLIPISPVTFIPSNWPWLKAIIVDLYELSLCKSVYFQSNWRKSKGARIERFVSVVLFKKRYYEEF